MCIQEYINELKKIQANLLDFLKSEETTTNLEQIFEDIKVCDNKHEFKLFLHLILRISNNYHRKIDFFNKIEQILQLLKNDIKKYFSNDEIFNIFKSNKRILLFLFEEHLITMNEYIINVITRDKYVKTNYPQYFSPEIKPFINEVWFQKYLKNINENDWVDEITKELPENFYEKRKIGENGSSICELIRNDSIVDFIKYINQNSIPLTYEIKPSIYETNSFLIKKQINEQKEKNKDNKLSVKLIEYAAFFGSIQIFQYLKSNGVDLSPSLWIYAIHSQNAEIINILEENQIQPDDKKYAEYFKESIKCHHIDLAEYVQSTYISEENMNDTLISSIKYYNFAFMQNDFKYETLFYYLCKYDYYLFVNILLTQISDINMTLVFNFQFINGIRYHIF